MTLEALQQLQRIEDLLIRVECKLTKLEWLGDQDKEKVEWSVPDVERQMTTDAIKGVRSANL